MLPRKSRIRTEKTSFTELWLFISVNKQMVLLFFFGSISVVFFKVEILINRKVMKKYNFS